MLDREAVATLLIEDQHNIEASLQFGVIRIPVNVFLCRSGDVPAFGPGNRLQRGIDRVITSCFDFDKDQVALVASDDVNFPVFDAEIFTQQLVSFAKQILGGNVFTDAKKSIFRNTVHEARKCLTYFKSTIFCEPRLETTPKGGGKYEKSIIKCICSGIAA